MTLELPYILARPLKRGDVPSDMRRLDAEDAECGPTDYVIIQDIQDADELDFIWEGHKESGEPYLTLDLETKGTEAHNPDHCPVLMGLYSPVRGGLVLDLRSFGPGVSAMIARRLAEWQVPLQMYNAVFDTAFLNALVQDYTLRFNLHSDVYVFARLICSEGWDDQRWGLKPNQSNLLGWEDKGDVLLVDWLRENGYVNQVGNVKKEEMWRAPTEILGHYCILDCLSTHLLYEKVFLPVIEKFPILTEYMQWFAAIIRNVVRQQLRGMFIDIPRLHAYFDQLKQDVMQLTEKFLSHEMVAPHIAEYNQYVITEFLKTEPTKYKKRKPEPKEPKKLKQNGDISKSWKQWKARHEEWMFAPQETTQHWELWKEKEKRVYAECHFNVASGADLRWLFYEKLKFPVKVLTDSELPAVSGDALLGFGEPGKIMDKLSETVKEMGYVKKAIEVSAADGLIHAQFKVPGTLTCRLAGGGGLSMHQAPKTPGYLSCFIARPGMRLVDIDYSGLEDYVLAELSRDPAMLALYGPNAPACQDGYIYVAAKLGSFGRPFLAAGYDPENPTPEAVKKCKSELKGLRNIAKAIKLAKNYGAGAKKIWSTLTLRGEKISFEEVKTLCNDFDKLFAGNVAWADLQTEIHGMTGGWVLDGLGGPVCIDPSKIKDLANRIVQRTGHLILAHYIFELEKALDASGIPWEPWIIDFHDEVILEVPEGAVQQVQDIMRKVIAEQVKFLGGIVRLKANPDEGACLAPFKVEDFKQWLSTQPIEIQSRLR